MEPQRSKQSWYNVTYISYVIDAILRRNKQKGAMEKIQRVNSSGGTGAPRVVTAPRTCSESSRLEAATVPAAPVQPPPKRSPHDYIFGRNIGDGSFAHVYQVKDIHNKREYAIKMCYKDFLIRERKTTCVRRERDVLNYLNTCNIQHFFIKLYCTFQDETRLFFVLTLSKKGDMLKYLTKMGNFNVECSRFYAAQILVALEHLKRLNIMHRDLKPENILFTDKYHIMLTDFGAAKFVGEQEVARNNERKHSFVGTAQYVSPEHLTEKTSSPLSDVWALGCLLYQMLSGHPPFSSQSEYIIFQKILKLDFEFPEDFDPLAKDLVKKLLVVEPSERLGGSDIEGYPSIRNHGFFAGVEWDKVGTASSPLARLAPPDELEYSVPDNLEPGLDDRQMYRLLGLDSAVPVCPPAPDLAAAQVESRLALQVANNLRWHKAVEGRLILRQGIVDKKKGLFSRRRVLLLTIGPRLFLGDPSTFTVKAEIPFSKRLTAEAKNFKIFIIHTPSRTYHLEDPDGGALDWCHAIEEARDHDVES